MPELLCAHSDVGHAGTTDVDVQVDLEIAAGAVNTAMLEQALLNAEFVPDSPRVWRWVAGGATDMMVVKFELLADLDTVAGGSTIEFDECTHLGAVNLRGTAYAARDAVVHELRARVGGVPLVVEVNVTGLAGFLLAKAAAARSRRKPKDWYDIAFVLLHNDAGGPREAAEAVRERFGSELSGTIRTALDDLRANFATPDAQGTLAYREQMLLDHPEHDPTVLAADAIVAVEQFHQTLFAG